jgi:hypothetical protein
MPREYPPAVLVHAENCEDVINLRRHGQILIPMATPDIARTYPNGRMHTCYHFSLQARGVVQTMTTRPPRWYLPTWGWAPRPRMRSTRRSGSRRHPLMRRPTLRSLGQ